MAPKSHSLSVTVTLWYSWTVTPFEDDLLRKEYHSHTWITENWMQGPPTDSSDLESLVASFIQGYQSYCDFSPVLGMEFLDGPQSIVNDQVKHQNII